MVSLISRTILAACVLILTTGCSANLKNVRTSDSLVGASYYIADTLENNLSHPISPNDSLLVASFVNVNRLERSSSFGRIISEQIASRFAQKGYKIIEMRLRENTVNIKEKEERKGEGENAEGGLKEKGEFLLSRELRAISKGHNCSAVIVGTYAEGYQTLYVSARIVRVWDGEVIASSDYGIRMSFKAMEILLRDS